MEIIKEPTVKVKKLLTSPILEDVILGIDWCYQNLGAIWCTQNFSFQDRIYYTKNLIRNNMTFNNQRCNLLYNDIIIYIGRFCIAVVKEKEIDTYIQTLDFKTN